MAPGCGYLRVVNWEVYQHYGDRTPPWIKLHVTTLEDPVLAVLPDATKAHVYGIWVLAARLKNRIPADAEFIAKRINATVAVDLKLLIRTSLLESHPDTPGAASDVLASCSSDKKRTGEEIREEGEENYTPPAAPAGPPAADAARAGAPPQDGGHAANGEALQQVFDHWRLASRREKAKLTPKRKRRVQERLREGYTVEELRRAVDGCMSSRWHQGANDRGKKFNDLELICRDGEHVERFMEETETDAQRSPARAAPPSPKAEARQAAANAAIAAGLVVLRDQEAKKRDRRRLDPGMETARGLLPGPRPDGGDEDGAGPGIRGGSGASDGRAVDPRLPDRSARVVPDD